MIKKEVKAYGKTQRQRIDKIIDIINNKNIKYIELNGEN